jgi:hypothetical protein
LNPNTDLALSSILSIIISILAINYHEKNFRFHKSGLPRTALFSLFAFGFLKLAGKSSRKNIPKRFRLDFRFSLFLWNETTKKAKFREVSLDIYGGL